MKLPLPEPHGSLDPRECRPNGLTIGLTVFTIALNTCLVAHVLT